jgi:hypothetical protein
MVFVVAFRADPRPLGVFFLSLISSFQTEFSLRASLLGNVPNLEATWRLKYQSASQPTSVQAI